MTEHVDTKNHRQPIRAFCWCLLVLYFAWAFAGLLGYNGFTLGLFGTLPAAMMASRGKGEGRWKIRGRVFFLIVVPVLWAVCSVGSYFYPGDEYYLYVLSSHVGLPGLALVDYQINNPRIIPAVVGTGAVVVGLLGALNVKTGATPKAFFRLVAGALAVVVIVLVNQVGGDRIVAKHGSYLAYLFGGLGFSIIWALVAANVVAMESKSADPQQ